ncbi:MAG TPA: FG-GAP-like repeat-containing protein, partial [Acidobacteriota bacterium]
KIYKNLNPNPKTTPRLDGGHFVMQTHPLVTDGEQSRTAVVDWNGDGRLDLIRGSGNGWVTYYENVGTNIDPVFSSRVKLQADGKEIRLINGPRDCPQGPSEPNSGYTAPVVVDFDGDGDLDLIVGDMRGYQTYFENIGTRSQPKLAAGRLIEVDGQRRSFGWRNEIAVGDIDGDGKVEIVSTAYDDRHISIYKPSTVQDDPKVLKVVKVAPLILDSGEALLPPHAGGNNNGDYMMKLVDWDGDGDLDLFVESVYYIWYYENVGTSTAPKFKYHGRFQVGGKDLIVSGHAGSIDAVDWNGDGRPDLIIGGESGWTYYFERTFLDGNLPRAMLGSVQLRP